MEKYHCVHQRSALLEASVQCKGNDPEGDCRSEEDSDRNADAGKSYRLIFYDRKDLFLRRPKRLHQTVKARISGNRDIQHVVDQQVAAADDKENKEDAHCEDGAAFGIKLDRSLKRLVVAKRDVILYPVVVTWHLFYRQGEDAVLRHRISGIFAVAL